MSDDEEDKLAADIREFDRLIAAHESRQRETDDTRDAVVDECTKLAVDAAKPDVNIDDDALNGIELVQLPVPPAKEKGKHLPARTAD